MAKRILIVEDSFTQAKGLELLFQMRGVDTIVAYDGQDGLNKALREQPDLVILDVILPLVDGLEVCRLLKKHPETAHIPVILFSVRDRAEDTIAGIEAGADAYIHKDIFDEYNLIRTTRSLGLLPWGVMLVSKDIDILLSWRKHLRNAPQNYAVSTAESLSEALVFMKEHSIDLVLIDQNVVMGDARDTLLRMKIRRPGLQMLILLQKEGPSVAGLPVDKWLSADAPWSEKLEFVREMLEDEGYKEAVPAPQAKPTSPSDDLQEPETKKAQVLIVEDSAVQASRLKFILEGHGLWTDIAPSGEEALEKVARHHYKLVILDIHLPGMDGFQVCRFLKQAPETADIPVIMLTARDHISDTLLGLELGAIDYIPKDAFSEDILLKTIEQLGLA